ncbi:MAG: hypothetical protein OXE99_00160 [Cellvibrionales bacterium]|nr:hypothetical protein [Cellvibrionales bacterium]
MLVDLIPANKLPYIVVWIDWCFYAYWPSFVFILIFCLRHYWVNISYHSTGGIALAILVGACSWVSYCAMRYGYSVG